MAKFKTILTAGAMILAISATSITAFAATQYKTPAEAVAGITGNTVESVVTQRAETNKTYGAIAKDAGKFEEFKAEMLRQKKEILAAQVKDGKITQEEADRTLKAIEENQAICDGTTRMGNGMGRENGGMGRGQGANGRGMGMGGMRSQDGSCHAFVK